jgi:hypothetical protein
MLDSNMAKRGSIAAMTDIFQRPVSPGVSMLDPAQGESPIDWRYTSFDIYGRGTWIDQEGLLGKVAKELKATELARVHALAGARPECPDGVYLPGWRPQGGALGQYLNGSFEVFGVPFNVGELRPPNKPIRTTFERTYVPSLSMRVRTEAAIIMAGFTGGNLKTAIGLHDNLTIDPDQTGIYSRKGDQGGGWMRQASLSETVATLNKWSESAFGGPPGTLGSRASFWLAEAPEGWILKSVAPTLEEWSNEWGTYK